MFKNYYKDNKELSRAMFLYISYSILGPLIIIGGLGYLISKITQNRFILLASVFVAFLFSNILMFRKLKKLSEEIEKIKVEKKEEDQDLEIVEERDINHQKNKK